jgi:AcrR family transcriptional regulator
MAGPTGQFGSFMTEHLDKDTRREQILDAAVKLFITQGYENSSVDEIAKEAGLSKGSIYWYFKSKLEILFEITDRYVEESQAEILRLAKLDAHGPESFYLCHREMTQCKDEESASTLLFNQLVALAGRHPEISERLREYHGRWIQTASGLVREGVERGYFKPVDPILIAQAITAMYDGLYMRKQMDPTLDVVSVLETATRLMYEGMVTGRVPAVTPVDAYPAELKEPQ